jgi:hypothetical protein
LQFHLLADTDQGRPSEFAGKRIRENGTAS